MNGRFYCINGEFYLLKGGKCEPQSRMTRLGFENEGYTEGVMQSPISLTDLTVH
jgi:hypothetical protein